MNPKTVGFLVDRDKTLRRIFGEKLVENRIRKFSHVTVGQEMAAISCRAVQKITSRAAIPPFFVCWRGGLSPGQLIAT